MKPAPPIEAGSCRLRRFAESDAERLAAIANHRQVWVNMTDSFPHPYNRADAEEWIALCIESPPPDRHLAIEYDGQIVGGIGVMENSDVQRHVGTVGYWVTPSHWGRGIATSALRGFLPYVFASFELSRVQASVHGWNPASGKVLEKCGFQLEGRLRGAVTKDGQVTDELIYGRLAGDSND